MQITAMSNNDGANYRFLLTFKNALSAAQIYFHQRPLQFVEGTINKMNLHWEKQLRQKQNELLSQNISAVIKPFSIAFGMEMNALFVNDKSIMYPGTTLSLTDWKLESNNLNLYVIEIPYPMIAMLADPEIEKNIIANASIQLRPSLAVCTFAVTADKFLVLTVRGQKTNIYPRRYYGQGGNPTHWNFNLLQHQLDEMQEELFISKEEVAINSLRFCGIVEDIEKFISKPDLIGWVNIHLTKNELIEKFETRSANELPPDVAGLHFVPCNKNSLLNFLYHETSLKFCPPAFGGLKIIASLF